MPTYNQGKYLENCLKAINFQTFKDYELIIVNDGSSDDTEKVIKEEMKKNYRIRYFEREHGGDRGISALNFGLTQTRGKYLTFLSSDNMYFSKFFEKLSQILRDTRADFVFADFLQMDMDGQIVYEFLRPEYLRGPFTIEHLKFGYTMGICFMYTREIKEKVGEYRDVTCSDYEMAVRMALKGAEFYHLESILGVNRQHDKQVSKMEKMEKDVENVQNLAQGLR